MEAEVKGQWKAELGGLWEEDVQRFVPAAGAVELHSFVEVAQVKYEQQER